MTRATIATLALALTTLTVAGCGGSTDPVDPVETATICVDGRPPVDTHWGTLIRGADATGHEVSVYVAPDDEAAGRFLEAFGTTDAGGPEPRVGRVGAYVYRWDDPPTEYLTGFLHDCLTP